MILSPIVRNHVSSFDNWPPDVAPKTIQTEELLARLIDRSVWSHEAWLLLRYARTACDQIQAYPKRRRWVSSRCSDLYGPIHRPHQANGVLHWTRHPRNRLPETKHSSQKPHSKAKHSEVEELWNGCSNQWAKEEDPQVPGSVHNLLNSIL